MEHKEQFSELQTVWNIFFEPGKTFDSFRQTPRFVIGTITLAVFTLIFSVAFFQKIGEENYRRFFIEQGEKSRQFQSLPSEEKEKIVETQLTSVKIFSYISPILTIAYIAIGGLIALAIGRALGSDFSYLQGVSLWLYSSFPPSVVFTFASLVVLFFKPADEIDLLRFQTSGFLPSNLGFLVNPEEMPALSALLGSIDLFRIWGWALFAIGLRRIGLLSSTAAWLTSFLLFIAFVAVSIISSFIFGAS